MTTYRFIKEVKQTTNLQQLIVGYASLLPEEVVTIQELCRIFPEHKLIDITNAVEGLVYFESLQRGFE